MTFNDLNLNTPLLNALADLGYTEPTPIQEKALPIAMSGRDVVGIAQTGTGKTFAYLLPILRLLKYSDQKEPRVLIVVPTRELVIQVVKEIENLTKYANTRTVGVYGGTNINSNKIAINNGMDILVATPGRMLDLTLTGVLRLKSIQKLVVDEVDEMLNLGFRTQLVQILDLLPKKRQSLLFSATLTVDVEKIIDDFFREPIKVEIEPHGTPLEKIIQQGFQIPNFYTKINLLEQFISQKEEFQKVLIFVESKKMADKLFGEIDKNFPNEIAVIHSNKAQNTRISELASFQDGTKRMLIATDLVARGLDIADVTHVINFDTPREPEVYIHRIGRTGRADKPGTAISFFCDYDLELKGDIEKMMKKAIPMFPLPSDLVISEFLTEEEKVLPLFDKDYLKMPTVRKSDAQFHVKKEKNKKVNLGGPKKRNPKFSASGKRLR